MGNALLLKNGAQEHQCSRVHSRSDRPPAYVAQLDLRAEVFLLLAHMFDGGDRRRLAVHTRAPRPPQLHLRWMAVPNARISALNLLPARRLSSQREIDENSRRTSLAQISASRLRLHDAWRPCTSVQPSWALSISSLQRGCIHTTRPSYPKLSASRARS